MLRFIGKWSPTLVGALLVYSGLYKLVHPAEATMALAALEFKAGLAGVAIGAVTILELYLGAILLLRLNLRFGLWVAIGLMFTFTLFLWHLSLLAHPPSCGCMGLTKVFTSNRHNALFGIGRNCMILWLLKWAYDYYVCRPSSGVSTSAVA